ncbi:5'-nucleotidase [Glutamicibacter ardleyensis]|uniref:5'-nucleotidase n=1 Tax=Glutamicibacter ardleyensis TaxID=225894 RepID=UPI003FD5F68D
MTANQLKELVIGIASSALFDLSEGDLVFRTEGPEAYREYQRHHRNDILLPGAAFVFIQKLLTLNELDTTKRLVQIVLLSRNSPETGYRVLNSIKHYELDVSRAVFTQGQSPYVYHQSFAIDLFLSENEDDVREAIHLGCPAGRVFPPKVPDPDPRSSTGIRLAFDFDGVLGDDTSERIYANHGLSAFQMHEVNNQAEPVIDGPIKPFFMAIAHIQRLDRERAVVDPTYERRLRTSIVTARNSPAEMRVLNSLDSWGVDVDDAFFLGGISKGPILQVLRPDIFFDDQQIHIENASQHTMSAHVIFGVRNESTETTETTIGQSL